MVNAEDQGVKMDSADNLQNEITENPNIISAGAADEIGPKKRQSRTTSFY